MSASLCLENVSLSFGNTPILRNVSLAVEPGEVVALLGPSGSGKSSILRVVAGLYRPDCGRIWIDGDDVSALAAARRDTAMVFQNFALYPHLTVAGNIATPLRLRRLPWWMRLPGMRFLSGDAATRLRGIDEEVTAAARLARVEDLLTRRPSQLSGGQKQRVAIARALVRRPKAFLLDEPFSSLDARLRESTLEEVRELQRRLRVSTLFVTHDHAEAFAFADRIAVIFDGEIVQLDTPSILYAEPKTRRIASFIGSPPMNFAPCAMLRTRHGLPAGAMDLGVRPQDLRISAESNAALRAVVRKTVMGGAQLLVTLDVEGLETPWRAVLQTTSTNPAEGASVGLTFEPGSAHFFDAAGVRLTARGSSSPAEIAFRPGDAA